jgi:fumarate reductase flavoprotein subunit
MDRLNLENLTLVSRAICAAADFRKNSRGAHFREDFPQAGDLASSAYTTVRLAGDKPQVENQPVAFTRVQPGESLLVSAPERKPA